MEVSPHERVQRYAFRIQKVQLQNCNTRISTAVTDKYLVGDSVNKVYVSSQPVNGHLLHICNRKHMS